MEHAWKGKNSSIHANVDECEGLQRVNNIKLIDNSLNTEISISTKNKRDSSTDFFCKIAVAYSVYINNVNWRST